MPPARISRSDRSALIACGIVIACCWGPLIAEGDAAATSLRDKTLVAWASPASLDQRGGSILTVDDLSGGFDAIVYGELTPRRWMAGSELFRRTHREQDAWAEETARPGEWVQMAIAYEGRSVSIYRNGELYSRYEMGVEPKDFGPQSVLVLGLRHLEAGNERYFAGRIRDARIYDRALSREGIRSLVPCAASDVRPWAWLTFDGDGPIDRTGRFASIELEGDVRIRDGALVLTEGNAAVVARPKGEPIAATPDRASWVPGSVVPRAVIESTRALREHMLADPYRPGYHFVVPEDNGRPGDPNGALFWNGRYHLMYLFHNGQGFAWGHVSSTDLVHWRHHPVALAPGDGDGGIFSGGASVDKEGNAVLTYWGLKGPAGHGICIARSRDENLDRWTKSPANPVVRSTEWGYTVEVDDEGREVVYGSADPSQIWIKGGRYYMLAGNLLVLNEYGLKRGQVQRQGDTLYLLVSDDLESWKYLHEFYKSDRKWTHKGEDNMCPSFLPLPASPEGGSPSDRYLLLFISHCDGCQYYVGTYENDRFHPEHHGRMTWVDNAYFAPEALIDDRGRQILWAWVFDDRPGDEWAKRGWSGTYGLPRSVWLGEDGTLRMRPVRELEALRYRPVERESFTLEADTEWGFEGVRGELLELEVTMAPGEGVRKLGLKVFCSPGGEEETSLYYDAGESRLSIDTRRSGLAYGRKVVEGGPLALAEGEPIRLRVFVDRSIVEVFANDRQAVCRRVYPTREDSTGVMLFAEGGDVRVSSVRAWRMMPSNPY